VCSTQIKPIRGEWTTKRAYSGEPLRHVSGTATYTHIPAGAANRTAIRRSAAESSSIIASTIDNPHYLNPTMEFSKDDNPPLVAKHAGLAFQSSNRPQRLDRNHHRGARVRGRRSPPRRGVYPFGRSKVQSLLGSCSHPGYSTPRRPPSEFRSIQLLSNQSRTSRLDHPDLALVRLLAGESAGPVCWHIARMGLAGAAQVPKSPELTTILSKM